jgi:hypothetical protein
VPVEPAFSQKVAPVPLDALAELVGGNEIHDLGENGLAGAQGAVLLVGWRSLPSRPDRYQIDKSLFRKYSLLFC